MDPLCAVKEEVEFPEFPDCENTVFQDVHIKTEPFVLPENVDRNDDSCLELQGKNDSPLNSPVETNPNITLKNCYVRLNRLTVPDDQPVLSTEDPLQISEDNNDQLKCHKCEKSFTQRDDYHSHLKTHLELELTEVQCDICKKTFSDFKNLLRHVRRSHSNANKFKCKDCGEEFKQKRDYKIHEMIHSGEKLFNCPECNKAFSLQSYLNKHIRSVHKKKKTNETEEIQGVYIKEEPLEWSENQDGGCEAEEVKPSSSSSLVLESAFEKVTVEENNDSLENSTMKESDSLIKIHVTDDKSLKSKQFPQKINVWVPVDFDSTLKPFKCDECDKTFTQKNYLTKHRRIHSAVKHFNCDECDKSFYRKNDLIKHMITHQGLKPFQCNICQKLFTRRDSLALHLQLHSGVKKFKCHNCQKLFSQKHYLVRHMKVHIKDKIIKCGECRKWFTSEEALASHMKFHSKAERPVFKCDECEKVFRLKSDLDSHMTIHPELEPFKPDRVQKSYVPRKHLRVAREEEKKDENMEVQDVYIKTEPVDVSENKEGGFAEEESQENSTGLVIESAFEKVTVRKNSENLGCVNVEENRENLETVTAEENEKRLETSPIESDSEEECDVSQIINDFQRAEENAFKCAECPKWFTNKSNLRNHMKVHTHEKSFKCDECQKLFLRIGDLRKHVETHKGLKTIKCEECEKTFIRRDSLTKHLRTHSKPFKCDKCEKAFSQKRSLIFHAAAHSSKETPFQCDTCQEYFISQTTLAAHRRIHSEGRNFKCDECSKSFFKSFDLNQHKIVHSGLKPFECDKCQKAFFRKINLVAHLNSHLGIKPFKCNVCKMSFAKHATAVLHMMMVHLVETPFRCKKCKEYFISEETLISHSKSHPAQSRPVKIHPGQKSFKCYDCDKTFTNVRNLKRHNERIHSQNYKCDECGEEFNVKRNYKLHLKVHAGVKLRNCPVCNMAFSIKYLMFSHMRLVHKIEKIEEDIEVEDVNIKTEPFEEDAEIQDFNIETEPIYNAESQHVAHEEIEIEEKPDGSILESAMGR